MIKRRENDLLAQGKGESHVVPENGKYGFILLSTVSVFLSSFCCVSLEVVENSFFCLIEELHCRFQNMDRSPWYCAIGLW